MIDMRSRRYVLRNFPALAAALSSSLTVCSAAIPNASVPTVGAVLQSGSASESSPIGGVKTALPSHPPTLWTAGAARVQIRRGNLPDMADHNALGLWLKGDGSSAAIRFRLFAIPAGQSLSDSATGHSGWVSPAIGLNFIGWKRVVISRSEFAYKTAPAEQFEVDSQLPPSALPISPPLKVDQSWNNINTVVVEANVPSKCTYYLDDMSWLSLDHLGVSSSTQSIEDFESGNVAAWAPLGPTELTDAVVYAASTMPGTVHQGRVSFRVTVTSPAFRRASVLLPAAKKLMAAAHKPYLIYVPGSLTDSITPASLPEPLAKAALDLTVCPDQVQSATFCLYTAKPIKELVLTPPEDLESVGHKILGSSLDVRIVDRPLQSGAGLYIDQNSSTFGNGLLLKNDLDQSSDSVGQGNNDRLTTALPADTTKQFWVTFATPQDAIPGLYTGKITLTSTTAESISIPITVKVLPLRLLSPAKQYVVDLRSIVAPAPNQLPSSDGQQLVTDYVTESQYQAQLADINEHGIRIATLAGPSASLLDEVTQFKNDRFLGPFVYSGDDTVTDLESVRKSADLPAITYLIPPDNENATAELDAVHKVGESAASFVTSNNDESDLASGVDIPIYNRDSTYAQELVTSNGDRKSSKRDWWYWNAASDNGLDNRLSAGYWLWKSKLYGAFIPQYQEAYGSDPRDLKSTGAVGIFSKMHPQMLTYPTADGVIDTVNWELIREGITDVRYLTTMYTALRECKDAHISAKLVQEAEAYADSLLTPPMALIQGRDVEQSRLKIADYAVRLREAVDSYNAKQPTGT